MHSKFKYSPYKGKGNYLIWASVRAWGVARLLGQLDDLEVAVWKTLAVHIQHGEYLNTRTAGEHMHMYTISECTDTAQATQHTSALYGLY